MLLYSQGVLDSTRFISDSLLTDTCTINNQGVNNALPVMTNRGGVSGAVKATYTYPCRMDVNVNDMLPEHNKQQIEFTKTVRRVYISLSDIQSIGYLPVIGDQLYTTAGDPLGNSNKYIIQEVNLETDDIDVELLVTGAP